MTNQAKGLLITTLGVLALTPDTFFVRIIEMDSISLLFWRGIATFTGLTVATLFQQKKNTIKEYKNIGKTGLLITFTLTGSSFCFVLALYHTSVANTLVILAAAPMFAALYSKLFLKENVASITIFTMIIVVVAIGVIVNDTGGHNSLLGNSFALVAAMCMAGAFTLMRKAKDRNMVPATALSGLITLCIAGTLCDSIAITQHQAIILIFMGLSFVVGFYLLTIGPRYISAPEVSLLMPLETVFGTLLVWIMIGEQPSTIAIIGGLVVIVALTTHSFLSLKKAQPLTKR